MCKVVVQAEANDAFVVSVKGDLNVETALPFRQRLAPVTATAQRIAFDMTELDSMDSDGLVALLTIGESLGHRGGHIRLDHLQPQVEKIFAVARSIPGIRMGKGWERE